MFDSSITAFDSCIIAFDSFTLFCLIAKICSTGRTQQEFEDEGTGTGLIVQTGQTPSDLMIIPRDEEQLQEDTLYEQGHCVSTMGKGSFLILLRTLQLSHGEGIVS